MPLCGDRWKYGSIQEINIPCQVEAEMLDLRREYVEGAGIDEE
jgi:hypothetical protein